MSNAFSESQLVEQPAMQLFALLGWEVVGPPPDADEDGQPRDAGLVGRETKVEVVLVPRLVASLEKLNPELPLQSILSAVEELTRDRTSMSVEAANREVYKLLKEGVSVSVPDKEHGAYHTERVRVIDWDTPCNNDFLLVSQFSITGSLYTCRPDLIGFVNGLPLVVFELKAPGERVRSAYDENLTHYKLQVPSLFWYNALIITSNGTDSKVGSLTAEWDRFFDWKRIESENEPRRASLEIMIRGTCEKNRLLDIVENFTLFSELKAGLAKVIGQNHQFLGVNSAITSMQQARALGHGRGGVFWQTQGSGKSFAMVFFAQKVFRKLEGNWTFVIVTDRVELDDQIATTFKANGAISEAEGKECHAESGEHLRELLRGNHRYVFTLIQKFQTSEMLCDRADVIVVTDEAHRSQYDTLAMNMRAALPNATFLAFTGTPLIAGEERTKEVFGDYVSIYDFQQSVQDGATVPLYYENRTPELQLTNPDLNDDIYELIESSELDPEQEAKLERELKRQYHIITRDDRLETVARDIVHHFLGRGFQGKAMVVSIDKATALKMYNKVKRYWEEERQNVNAELTSIQYQPEVARKSAESVEREGELIQRLELLDKTDMAVVVSPSQNEIQQMQKLGLDIEPHRRLMRESDPGLDERFKDTADPLRLVFVCAMWLTGFDAPSCSTIYLDKPMRNHTLMQAIARANRVFPGKHSGVIVDYANVFASLESALAIYGAGKDGKEPIKDKQKLVDDLHAAMNDAIAFCLSHNVDLGAIEAMPKGSMQRLQFVNDAVEAFIAPDELRKEFFARVRLTATLFAAVKPDPIAVEFASRMSCLEVIADAIRVRINPVPPDISVVMGGINTILDNSITGLRIRDSGPPALDLSRIDFDALSSRFKQSKHKNTEIEVLKAAIRKQLERLIELNSSRADFAKQFEEIIENYNTGSRNIAQLFEELVKFSRSLTEEEQRHVRENMSEEELVIFDILTRPAPELTSEEREQVKRIAKELIVRIKDLLVINWRQKTSARSRMVNAIDDALDNGLPEKYNRDMYKKKCSAVFEHVFEKYPERNAGVYSRGSWNA